MSKKKEPKVSESLSEFIQMLEEIKRDYEWSKQEVSNLEALTQDYLHKLELDNLNYSQRAKVATELAKVRQTRRLHKNQVEALEPVVALLESDRGKNFYNLLREVLGKVRKSESSIERRMYSGRILNETYKHRDTTER